MWSSMVFMLPVESSPTVRYRTPENSTLESCFYASDAFQARLLAIEFNNYIKDHPNRIVKIFSATSC